MTIETLGVDIAKNVFQLHGVSNRYEDGGAFCPRCDWNDCGVWCDHPGQRRREHEGAGRPSYTMSCELALVAGRLYDSPGCAESADPLVSCRPPLPSWATTGRRGCDA